MVPQVPFDSVIVSEAVIVGVLSWIGFQGK